MFLLVLLAISPWVPIPVVDAADAILVDTTVKASDLQVQLSHDTCNAFAMMAASYLPPDYDIPSRGYVCSFQPDLNEMCHPGHLNSASRNPNCTPSKPPAEVVTNEGERGVEVDLEINEEVLEFLVNVSVVIENELSDSTAAKEQKLSPSGSSPSNTSRTTLDTLTIALTTAPSTSRPSPTDSNSPVAPGPSFTSWRCVLYQNKICDGTSQCLTDECDCKNIDVFYCADKAGCIAHRNVCDGIEDCRDGSDECMCDDIIHCELKSRIYCVPRQKFCEMRETLYINCASTGNSRASRNFLASSRAIDSFHLLIYFDEKLHNLPLFYRSSRLQPLAF